MISIHHNSLTKPASPPEPHKLVLISAVALERAIAALAPAADFAGDVRALGEPDSAVIDPLLPIGTYRRIREVRRLLMQEFAAND